MGCFLARFLARFLSNRRPDFWLDSTPIKSVRLTLNPTNCFAILPAAKLLSEIQDSNHQLESQWHLFVQHSGGENPRTKFPLTYGVSVRGHPRLLQEGPRARWRLRAGLVAVAGPLASRLLRACGVDR